MKSEIEQKYGNRLRVRACGICWRNNKLLVVNHQLRSDSDFWAPVGGGIEFGESALKALVREFKEEANIIVQPGKFLFGCEYIKSPLHAIELFFEVYYESGKVLLGEDPEDKGKHQILKDIRYMDFAELMTINPDERHGIFRLTKTAEDLKKLSGFYII